MGLFPCAVEAVVALADVELAALGFVGGVVPCALVDDGVVPAEVDDRGEVTAVVDGPPLPGFVTDGLTGATFGVDVPDVVTADGGNDGLVVEGVVDDWG